MKTKIGNDDKESMNFRTGGKLENRYKIPENKHLRVCEFFSGFPLGEREKGKKEGVRKE